MTISEAEIKKTLGNLYGQGNVEPIWGEIRLRLNDFVKRNPQLILKPVDPNERLTEQDIFLITYGDQFANPKETKLKSLKVFLDRYLAGVCSGVHILPFYPYSSDDGFSVIDYRKVDPDLGDWEDVEKLGENYRLMFDAVINHISQESEWFQKFLRNEPPYNQFFIEADPDEDTSMVVRPRALPLLKEVEVNGETKHVWTTFSADQIDLNYANPAVFVEILDLLLFYVERGAEVIRLDAIAYLWKQIGTPSIHLPETHQVIKLIRAVLDNAAPNVVLITETNVPHKDNISYFGSPLPGSDTFDEAQMVYQFPLPPLILHSFISGSTAALVNWLKNVTPPSDSTTFFNFTASHDGIGLMPAKGILTDEKISQLVDQTLAHGGRVSNKTNSDGSQSPYELNITLYDALNHPENQDEELDIKKFIASQAIMLSLQGVPGVYVHSLFGSRNCNGCEAETGRARSINREKFLLADLEHELSDPTARKTIIFNAVRNLIKTRSDNAAFHPNAGQTIMEIDPRLFVVKRTSMDAKETVVCIHNVSDQRVDLSNYSLDGELQNGTETLTNTPINDKGGGLPVAIDPYRVMWIKYTNG